MTNIANTSWYYRVDTHLYLDHKNKNYPSYFATSNLKAARKTEILGCNVCFDHDVSLSGDKYISTMQGKKIKKVFYELINLSKYDYFCGLMLKLKFLIQC